MQHKRKLRWLPLAACLILLFGAITDLAATHLGPKLLRKFTSQTESDYELTARIEQKSLSCFS